ncbi:MAG: ROK family protein [Firmicutes bacterium]|nr:ROK family protein [Clostridia bacterium]MBS5021567.1 ROK family protein [Bacillota bacterium]
MQAYIIGIDLGGMSAKAALFDKEGRIVAKKSIVTNAADGFEGTAAKLAEVAKGVAQAAGAAFEDVEKIGIASPGVVNSKTGVILKWSNYGWTDVPLGDTVAKLTGKKVCVVNDANAAAFGEAKFGSGSLYQSSIFITLGTGVGGGIVVDGKMLEGYMSAGAEIGHMSIRGDGLLCGCGRHGCFECYASATALIRQTKKRMEENCDSKMWEIAQGSLDNVDGRTAFEGARRGDKDAQEVVNQYIEYLAVGIANLVNILRPEAVVLGGGIACEGEGLFVPLRKAVEEQIYVCADEVPLKIVGAKLGNDAGMYGAYAQAKENG